MQPHKREGIIKKKMTRNQRKETTIQRMKKMNLTILRSNILLLMINTNGWRIGLMPWRFKGCLV